MMVIRRCPLSPYILFIQAKAFPQLGPSNRVGSIRLLEDDCLSGPDSRDFCGLSALLRNGRSFYMSLKMNELAPPSPTALPFGRYRRTTGMLPRCHWLPPSPPSHFTGLRNYAYRR